MDASTKQINQSSSVNSWQFVPAVWAVLLSAFLVCMLLGSAVVLILRRGAGALAQPLPAGWLLIVGLIVACAVIAARRMIQRQELISAAPWLRQTILWGPTLAVAMFAIALSIEGTSLLALAAYLVLIVGAEFFAEQGTLPAFWTGVRKRLAPSLNKPAQKAINRPAPSQITESAVNQSSDTTSLHGNVAGSSLLDSALDDVDEEELEEPLDENVWQQMSRMRTEAGEIITGWVKTEFQPGERTAVLHVAFCPPLLQAPQVQIEQLSGPAARIKVGQVLPQGARFEIRLNTSGTQAETLMLEFVALEHPMEEV